MNKHDEAEARAERLRSSISKIQYHAIYGHQDRPAWKRLDIISQECGKALAATQPEEADDDDA